MYLQSKGVSDVGISLIFVEYTTILMKNKEMFQRTHRGINRGLDFLLNR